MNLINGERGGWTGASPIVRGRGGRVRDGGFVVATHQKESTKGCSQDKRIVDGLSRSC